MANMRKTIKEIEAAVEAEWSDYRISHSRGGHICVTLRCASATRKVFTGSTTGDKKRLLNFRQDLRRNIKILKNEARV